MQRRDFLTTSLTAVAITGRPFAWAGSAAAPALLLEAAQFQERGGWVLDQQFMDQMGSGFLLAHGLGRPVADAVAKVKFPATGMYRLWVRTRDWVAPWKTADTVDSKRAFGTPGVFKVLVNGAAVETTFGDRRADWHWQDGGTVEIAKPETTVALHDLTGFEGRCAGVFLTKDSGFVPPDGGEALQQFRRAWHGHPEQPEDGGDFDLVVVGGGMAGACAAVMAARLGVKVALVQDRPMIGGNNSSEVRVWLNGAKRSPRFGILGSLLAEFEPAKRAHVGSAEIYEDDRRNGILLAEENLSFFPLYRVNGVEKKGNRLTAVIAESAESGRRLRFTAKQFADCTGDACVGYLAGADWEMTLEEGHMGRTNLWYAEDTGEPQSFPRCPWALDLSEKPFPGREHPGEPDKNSGLARLGRWFWESGFYHDPFEKSEYVRDWNFRALYGAWDCLKNVEKVFPNHQLAFAAFISGKRESRRLLGDLILNKEDVTKPIEYEDGFVPTGWKIDLHLPDPRYVKGFEGDAFISTAHFTNCVQPYHVPYRCLYSRNLDNLFMAGRDISVTHEALGTVRVMRTCGLMGEVVGMAAAVCKRHGIDPRGVYAQYLGELQELAGFGVAPPAPSTTNLTVLPPGAQRRASDEDAKYDFVSLPEKLKALPCVVVPRGEMHQPGAGFQIKLSAPATLYLAVHDRGGFVPPEDWKKTDLKLTWMKNLTDTVYKRTADAGIVDIPGHTGQDGAYYGIPNTVFVEGEGVEISKVE